MSYRITNCAFVPQAGEAWSNAEAAAILTGAVGVSRGSFYDTRHAAKVATAFSGVKSGFTANSKIETLSKLT